MDGVLERIDEDEEQKTDQSALTDPEEGEGAGEMRSAEKIRDNAEEGVGEDFGDAMAQAIEG